MKVIIVDDHPLARKGICSILSLESDIQVAGEASNISEAVKLIANVEPDLALKDLRLADEYGLNVVEKVKKEGFTCKFVVLTSSAEEEDIKKAEKLGVNGYVLKEALPEEILYVLRIVARGRKYYDPSIMELMMKAKEESYIDELTPRELEVLVSLGKGLSNSAIAKSLFISEYTVKKHVSQIFDKLNLTDRTQAALYANNKGLVKYILS